MALGVSWGAARVGSGRWRRLAFLAALVAALFIVRELRAPYRSDIGTIGYVMALYAALREPR